MTDAIVIGAGANGLTAASYLAKAGMKVLVLEKRAEPGGLASNEEIAPGFRCSIGPDLCGLLLPQVVSELELERHGLELLAMDPLAFAPSRDGEGLLLWRGRAKTLDEIRKISPRDAEAYPRFAALVEQLSGFLKPLLSQPAPTPEIEGGADLLNLLKLGWGFRQLGARPMHELLRILPMSLADFLDEWFESDLLKAMLAAPALEGVCLGPRSAGTAALFLYHQLGDSGEPLLSCKIARDGAAGVSRALSEALRANGGSVRTGAPVARLRIDEGRAQGVVLESGEELAAPFVLSSVSPRTTFRELSGTRFLEPSFLAEIDNIRYRGVTAKLNLALSELPDFKSRPGKEPAAHHRAVIHIGPDLDFLERAYDAAKYETISERPFLQALIPSLADPGLAPEGKHVMSVTIAYAPYRLRAGSWAGAKTDLAQKVLGALSELAPNLETAVLHHRLWTPEDYEAELALPEGSWHQGEMALDQMFFMRPVPGWARYRTPIDGLYLCGSSTHPGGGLTAACGYNAARQVLKDRG